jgi:glycosyltransferase involved in cell wall biosynthesis
VRVLLDSRPAADQGCVGRYARCLLGALRETAAASDEVLETNRPSRTVRAKGPDVFHSPWMDGAMLHSPCPMVVTVHDVAALKRRSEHLRSSLRMRLRPLAVQRAARVIVPTVAVGEDAVEHLRLDPNRIAVIPEAANVSMYRRTVAEVTAARLRFDLPEHYLVWVGGLQHPDPASHIAKLAAAPRELPLVLVGATAPWAHELPDVTLTGEIDDEDVLSAVYSGAHALLISSEQEGFGLSAVEALACGTPVVAADGPALREVLVDRATFVAPGDMRALLEAAHGVSRPAPRPPSFTWGDAARSTWSVYAHAAEEGGTTRNSTRVMRSRRAAGGLEAQ